MKIAVCVSHVPDTATKIKIGENNKTIDPTDVSYIINPYDEFAVEEALKTKEKLGGEVVAISLGGDANKESIRKALAMGVDSGVLLKDENYRDSHSLAFALSEEIKAQGADLVFFGKQAVDYDNSITGQLTAKVLAVGLLNTDTEGSLVLYNSKDNEEWEVENRNIKYKGNREKEILKLFWAYISKTDKVITFNGRNFDIPFLMLRSAMLGVKPSINIIHNRYNITKHIDLLDQFTFYGMSRKFNLDFYCHAFGITSPKSKGISGMEIKQMYKARKIKDIAVYCGEDIKATYELYNIWNEYLNI